MQPRILRAVANLGGEARGMRAFGEPKRGAGSAGFRVSSSSLAFSWRGLERAFCRG